MNNLQMLRRLKNERDVLAHADSPWLVQLVYSFQDASYLYLAMVKYLLHSVQQFILL